MVEDIYQKSVSELDVNINSMDKIYENCLRRIMILKAKRKMNVATEEEKELIEQLDLFLDCFVSC